MVGFVLPICEKSGFPLTNRDIINSIWDVENAFKNKAMSRNAYLFTAQPLIDNAPSFFLDYVRKQQQIYVR